MIPRWAWRWLVIGVAIVVLVLPVNWLVDVLGWPQTGAGRGVLFAVLYLGVWLLGSLSEVFGWFDRTHQRIRKLQAQSDYGSIVSLAPSLEDDRRPPIYRATDFNSIASAGMVTGAYRVSLEHADRARRAFQGLGKKALPAAEFAEWLKAGALVQLGRFDEARSLLGSDVTDRPLARRLAAQIAVEVGDDEEAFRLLAEPEEDDLGEAGRLRILGDFHVRRGRLAGGIELLEQAMAIYDANGLVVDAANCRVHLAEAGLAADQPRAALEHITAAIQYIGGVSGDNHADISHSNAVLAQVLAALGDGEAAQDAADLALSLAIPTEAPALIAVAHEGAAAAAAARGDHGQARGSLATAIGLLNAIGAKPEAERLEAVLNQSGPG